MPNENSQPEAPIVDAFGTDLTPIEAPAVVEPVVPDENLTPIQQTAKLAEDVGTFRTRSEQLEKDLAESKQLHAKKDTDIRALVDKVKRAEAGSGGAPAGGEAQEGEVPFKEIKTSKDLTVDEKDEMTDAEIKAMDEMAVLKKTINDQSRALAAKVAPEALDVNKTVKDGALALAGNDVATANKLIDAFNGSKFDTAAMSADEITTALTMVAQVVTGYVAPKEGALKPATGKPAIGGTASDPYGNNAIVKQANKAATTEGYSL